MHEYMCLLTHEVHSIFICKYVCVCVREKEERERRGDAVYVQPLPIRPCAWQRHRGRHRRRGRQTDKEKLACILHVSAWLSRAITQCAIVYHMSLWSAECTPLAVA